jgi:hypothetical protein
MIPCSWIVYCRSTLTLVSHNVDVSGSDNISNSLKKKLDWKNLCYILEACVACARLLVRK